MPKAAPKTNPKLKLFEVNRDLKDDEVATAAAEEPIGKILKHE